MNEFDDLPTTGVSNGKEYIIPIPKCPCGYGYNNEISEGTNFQFSLCAECREITSFICPICNATVGLNNPKCHHRFTVKSLFGGDTDGRVVGRVVNENPKPCNCQGNNCEQYLIDFGNFKQYICEQYLTPE